MIKCPNCGRTYSNLVKICPTCKTPLSSQTQELPKYNSNNHSNVSSAAVKNVVCPSCGNSVKEGAKFCDSCGARLTASNATPSQSATKSNIINQQPITPQPVRVTPIVQTNYNSQSNNQYQSAQNQNANGYVDKGFFNELKSFNFEGRLNRARYWKYILFDFLIMLAIGFAFGFVSALLRMDHTVIVAILQIANGILMLPFCVRRLHDLNKSGWFILLTFIPIVNFIFGIYVGFFKGTDGPNQYGPDPLQ